MTAPETPLTVEEVMCPECCGLGMLDHCIEDTCSCLSGDECWDVCPVCEGEGTLPAIHHLPAATEKG